MNVMTKYDFLRTESEYARNFIMDYSFRSALSVLKSLRFYADKKDLQILDTLRAEIMQCYQQFVSGVYSAAETTGDGLNLVLCAYDCFNQILSESDLTAMQNFSVRSVLSAPKWRYVKNRRTALQTYSFQYVSALQVVSREIRAEIQSFSGFDTRRQKATYFADINENDERLCVYVPLNYCRVSSVSGYMKDTEITEKVAQCIEEMTDRQKTVFMYLCKGYGARIIAQKLNVRLSCAQTHMQKVRAVCKRVFGISDTAQYCADSEIPEITISDFSAFCRSLFRSVSTIGAIPENEPAEIVPDKLRYIPNFPAYASAQKVRAERVNSCLICTGTKYRVTDKTYVGFHA